LGGAVSGLGAGLAACGGNRRRTSRGYAFVATRASKAIAVVDLTAFAVRTRISLPAAPATLIAHPTQHLLYAALPETQTLEEIDSKRWKLTRKVKLPGKLTAMRFSPGAERIWALISDPPLLVPIDTVDLQARQPIPLPAQPASFDLSPRDPAACVGLLDGSIVFADLKTGRVSKPRHISTELGVVRFRSDGKQVIAADKAERLLSILDASSGELMTQLPLPLRPDNVCFKPDGGQLFLTGEGRDAVVIAYPYRTEVAQTNLSGRAPGAMAASMDPDYLFVANPGAGSVTIFDLATQRVVAVTAVGVEPFQIVVTPDQQFALVLNRGNGDLAVIRIDAIKPGRAKSAPLFTMIPVGAEPVDMVVRSS